jgi:hypothetical protein
MKIFAAVLVSAAWAWAQPGCPATPIYTPCDLVFEMNAAESSEHPNPYTTIELKGEFRSPGHKTYLMPAFWDGGNRLVIRFTPVEAGQWDFRITSNLQRFNAQTGTFQATPSEALGFVRAAAMHHWATHYSENPVDRKPHLWMGDTNLRFAFMDRAAFEQYANQRAEQKFNHVRGLLLGTAEDEAKAFSAPDKPNPDFFREVDSRVRYLNSKGIVFDLILARSHDGLSKMFPTWQDRQRFLQFVIAHYAPLNVTWQGVQDFETYTNAKAFLKEIGTTLKQMDPYDHPRSTDAAITSSPCTGDQWMSFVESGSQNYQLGAIEHQLYPAPFVNAGIGRDRVSAEAVRHQLWNAAMNGEYVTLADQADPAAPKFMTNWYTFFDGTRHWELEPYFDVDGGRALALENIEYIIYVEKPGPVEVAVQKQSYDVRWYNPITGEFTPDKKFKADRWAGEPPDRTHDWVLHISREGKKEGMLKSYRFVSRDAPIQLQEPEITPKAIVFDATEPPGPELSISKPARYAAKLKRETRATRTMCYLWTGEVLGDGQGFRVLGTGQEGEFQVSKALPAPKPDSSLTLHVTGMNANGKVYILDRVYKLVP